MMRYKMRIVALALASVLTVASVFATNNFKNSIMSIDFEPSNNGIINMTIQTKTHYQGSVSPIKKDLNTYVLMLPETNSNISLAKLDNVASYIRSVDIKTLPYTKTGKGYTKITIVTYPSAQIQSKTKIFTPNSSSYNYEDYRKTELEYQRNLTESINNTIKNNDYQEDITSEDVENDGQIDSNNENIQEISTEDSSVLNTTIDLDDTEDNGLKVKDDPTEKSLLLLGILLIIAVSIYCYIKAKDKMHELSGETIKLELDDNEDEDKKNKPKKQQKKLNQIKSVIKTLDSTYSKTAYSRAVDFPNIQTKKETEDIKPIETIDLDTIFNEQKNKDSLVEENLALEEFLNGFSFNEYEAEPIKNNYPEGYDVDFYQKTISDGKIRFSQDDINCINKLLNNEINDTTLKNIKEYAISCPIKKTLSKEQMMENLITEYTVNQNIYFTDDDIKILHQLVNIEIDSSFVKDLRTNPERTKKMYEEIQESYAYNKKPSETTILSVKDNLPNLSEEIQKNIIRDSSDNKNRDVVYYKDGYDFNKLAVSEELPDLIKELEKNKAATYETRPNNKYIDEKNIYGTLKVSDELPDLQDALANPEKYSEPEVIKEEADENALLNNIMNVTFKPFYDGTQEFEVLNKKEDFTLSAFNDITKEFEQFSNDSIESDSDIKIMTSDEIQKDFEKLYNNEYFDLDNKKPEVTYIEDAPLDSETKVSDTQLKCLWEGASFSVLNSTNFDSKTGCHLAKNAGGYVVFGFINDKLFELKHFNNINSERIHSRLSEKLINGNSRYIIRIGTSKFIVEKLENEIKYVMDL